MWNLPATVLPARSAPTAFSPPLFHSFTSVENSVSFGVARRPIPAWKVDSGSLIERRFIRIIGERNVPTIPVYRLGYTSTALLGSVRSY